MPWHLETYDGWGLKCEGDILGLASSSLVRRLKMKVGLSGSRRKETEAGSEAETRELQLHEFLYILYRKGSLAEDLREGGG